MEVLGNKGRQRRGEILDDSKFPRASRLVNDRNGEGLEMANKKARFRVWTNVTASGKLVVYHSVELRDVHEDRIFVRW